MFRPKQRGYIFIFSYLRKLFIRNCYKQYKTKNCTSYNTAVLNPVVSSSSIRISFHRPLYYNNDTYGIQYTVLCTHPHSSFFFSLFMINLLIFSADRQLDELCDVVCKPVNTTNPSGATDSDDNHRENKMGWMEVPRRTVPVATSCGICNGMKDGQCDCAAPALSLDYPTVRSTVL